MKQVKVDILARLRAVLCLFAKSPKLASQPRFCAGLSTGTSAASAHDSIRLSRRAHFSNARILHSFSRHGSCSEPFQPSKSPAKPASNPNLQRGNRAPSSPEKEFLTRMPQAWIHTRSSNGSTWRLTARSARDTLWSAHAVDSCISSRGMASLMTAQEAKASREQQAPVSVMRRR